MSIFASIVGAVFGHSAAATTASPTVAAGAAPTPGAPPASKPAASPAVTPSLLPEKIDVASIIDKAVAASGENLDWRTSIVDLMKALGQDSSLAARKQLASELNYTGNTNDSAAMNVWLHKQVLAKLVANGGKLPADVKI
jgi:uncharacterized protein DUF3597